MGAVRIPKVSRAKLGSERLDCADEDLGTAAERVPWFKTGIHVYDGVELAETYALSPAPQESR